MGPSIAAGIRSDAANTVVDVAEVLTNVNFVPIDRGRIFSRRPAKDRISQNICCLISRVWIRGLARPAGLAEHITDRVDEQLFALSVEIILPVLRVGAAGGEPHPRTTSRLARSGIKFLAGLPGSDPYQIVIRSLGEHCTIACICNAAHKVTTQSRH
ncbi:hypothetical protein ES703_121392 [subsurface metagenome]